jgi:TatD DNase family protein
MFIDTHCHLNFRVFKGDVANVIKRAKKAGVEEFIVPGTDLATSERAVELAHIYPNVYAAVGIHPHHTLELTSQTIRFYIGALSRLKELAQDKKVVAIGEIGLDYHQYKGSSGVSPKEKQKDLFLEQLNIAQELNLPVVIHCREAFEDIFAVLPNTLRGVLHCFTGGLFHLEEALGRGLLIGFDGNITYNSSLLPAVTKTPLDKLLLETDAPLLTPRPLRGERNEPKNIVFVASFIAKTKKITRLEVINQTTENTRRLFNF